MRINKSTFQLVPHPSRWVVMFAALALLGTLPGCVTHVIKDNSVTAQLRRATGNGQGWYVTKGSNSKSSGSGNGGFTPHHPGNFIFDPSQPGQ